MHLRAVTCVLRAVLPSKLPQLLERGAGGDATVDVDGGARGARGRVGAGGRGAGIVGGRGGPVAVGDRVPAAARDVVGVAAGGHGGADLLGGGVSPSTEARTTVRIIPL